MSYGVMNGSTGCLPDSNEGPFDTELDAIRSAVETFNDLPADEIGLMVANLADGGIHYFNIPQEAGADYVEIYKWEEFE